MQKEKIVRMGQVDRVFYEKRILQSVAHPFLVDLRYVFKTNLHLCIVMPFIRGGEIFSYMRAFRAFSEYQTQFYAAQMVLALQYLHSMRIIYRDLKPENVLLECDGYIKITDFGFSKRLEGPNTLTTSFVGTPEYMAPEMLVKTLRVAGYSYSVDWWTLGVFIYESAAGAPPFSGSSLLAIFDRVVRGEFILPDHFSIGMADLVIRLFEVDPDHRIGCGRNGAEEIKSHYWFSSINWQALIEKKVRPEFVPNCSDDDVTSNFEVFEEEPIECGENPVYTQEFNSF